VSVNHRHSNRLGLLALATNCLGLYACSGAPAPSDGAGISSVDQELLLQFEPDRLRNGKTQTLVEGIKSIENQLFTKSGRLLVTGDEGIFEIVVGAGGDYQAKPVHTGETCWFGGITEYRDTVYANCYDMTNGNASLFASPVTTATDELEFRVIHSLPGVALANGLTADGNGNLFVASTFDGKIIRLRVQDGDPLSIVAQDDFNARSGAFTNGLKYFDANLYWTAFTTLYAAPIKGDGTAGPTRMLSSEFTFFDDLYVDGNGIWQADYLNGTIVASEHDGTVQASTRTGSFDGPSSLQPAYGRLRLPPEAFLVTEKNQNRLSLYVQ